MTDVTIRADSMADRLDSVIAKVEGLEVEGAAAALAIVLEINKLARWLRAGCPAEEFRGS